LSVIIGIDVGGNDMVMRHIAQSKVC